MVGVLQPLGQQFPITNSDGTPTNYFIRWAQQRQQDIGSSVSLDQVKALIDEISIKGTLPITVTGSVSSGLTIAFNGGLKDLNDVDITTVPPTDGQVLKYKLADGKWEPGTGGGGGGSTIWAAGVTFSYTSSGGPIVILGSSNVASVTRVSGNVGKFIVTFTNPAPNADWVMAGKASCNPFPNSGAAGIMADVSIDWNSSPTASTAPLIIGQNNSQFDAMVVRLLFIDPSAVGSLGGSGGGGGGGVPTIIQKAFARFQTNNTITLPAAPTPGNTLLLMSTGAGGSPAGIPAGFTPLGYSAVGNNVPPPGNGQQFQHSWAATKNVAVGDSATWNISTADWANLALYELQGPVCCDYISSGMATSGSAFQVSPALPRMGGGLRFVFVEQDAANDLTFDTISGLSTEHQFTDASSGNNHRALLGLVTATFGGMVTGTSSSYTYPQYTLVSAAT